MLTPMDLGHGRSALFFSAVAFFGGSGGSRKYALLRQGRGSEVENLFPSDLSLSLVGQHAFWADESISDAPIFATADFLWGANESHLEPHRYIVSSYILKPPVPGYGFYSAYVLDDQYMTAGKYSAEGDQYPKLDILGAEKPEILSHLKRAKVEAEREQPQAK